jgi:hypothetical protein
MAFSGEARHRKVNGLGIAWRHEQISTSSLNKIATGALRLI